MLNNHSHSSPKMDESQESELISIPPTPKTYTPSGQRSPQLQTTRDPKSSTWTPTSFLSPIGTPMKRVLVNMKGYLEEVGHLTKLNPQDAWLPITESRNGNAHYAAFHNLNAGVGFQALLLPVAFAFLGWSVYFLRYARFDFLFILDGFAIWVALAFLIGVDLDLIFDFVKFCSVLKP